MPRHTRSEKAKKTKTPNQIRLLLSKASPINKSAKSKLVKELKSGKVKIRATKKKKR